MRWSDIPTNPAPKALRQFAGAWLGFFSAWGAYQYLARGHHRLGIALVILAAVFGLLGLAKPPAVRWLFVLWMRLAFPIGWVISQVMLLLMFYGLVTPLAFWFRLRRRDLLEREPAPGRSTFWAPKSSPQDVRRYFSQY